jgi:CheY-like chemotaxis protein
VSERERIADLLPLLARMVSGERAERIPLSDACDEIDTIAYAVNALLEELDDALARLRAAREHAENANRVQTLFLRNASHELRTPIAAILAMDEQLQCPSVGEKRQRELHARIQANGRQLAGLIDDLLIVAAEESQPPPRTAAPPPCLSGCRILVAEDNEDIRDATRCLLQRLGACVKEACDGLEAVELAAVEPFDLVLMDVRMPRLDGLAATRRLRQLGVRAPIVALTADGVAEHRDECLGAGCDGHLVKPLDAALLTGLLDEIRIR